MNVCNDMTFWKEWMSIIVFDLIGWMNEKWNDIYSENFSIAYFFLDDSVFFRIKIELRASTDFQVERFPIKLFRLLGNICDIIVVFCISLELLWFHLEWEKKAKWKIECGATFVVKYDVNVIFLLFSSILCLSDHFYRSWRVNKRI